MGNHLSASQVETFKLCQRKWAWKYIMGHSAPAHPSADLGSKVHKALENYLKGVAMPNPNTKWGSIACTGIPHLPLPSPELEIERQFYLDTEVVRFLGFVDLGYWKGDRFVNHDHKTTGNMQWAKTPEYLVEEDIQATLYAAVAFERFGGDEVILNWMYMQTRGTKKAKLVEAVMPRAQCQKNMSLILSVAEEMVTLRSNQTHPLDMPPCPEACGAFGGCPWKELCNLTPMEVLEATMSKSAMLERMKKKQAEKEAAKAPPEEIVKAEQERIAKEMEDPRSATRNAMRAKLYAKKGVNPPEKDNPPDPEPEPLPAKAKAKAKKADPAPAKTKAEDGEMPQMGFTLLVDCAITKFPNAGTIVVPATTIFHDVMQKIYEKHGITHYKFAEYGQSPALFSGALLAYLMANPLTPKHVITTTLSTNEGRDSFETLAALAGVVIRGF